MIYGICLDLQKDLIRKHCFGDCGKVLIGGIEFMNMAFFPCNIKECPFEEANIDARAKTFDGQDLFIRKLREEK